MAISLDYIGKYVIMMVVIAVAITLIMTFQDDVEGNIPTVPGDDSDTDQKAEVVEVATAGDAEKGKIANLIRLCQERAKQKSTSFTCFILVSSDDGTFEFTLYELGNDYGLNVQQNCTAADPCPYSGSRTLIIRYSLSNNGVVIEQP